MDECFHEFVLGGRTISSLASTARISPKTLTRYVHLRLGASPPELVLPLPPTDRPAYLILDGLWFGKLFVLLLYRIAGQPFIIHVSVAKREWGYHIERDLKSILSKGYVIAGVVSDGGKGIVNAVSTVFPTLPHQICLAHLHRDASRGLGRHPKDPPTQRLKSLVDHLFLIESREALSWWRAEVEQFALSYDSYLREYTHDPIQRRWWYTHRAARRTLCVLRSAPEQSFVFLRQQLMPRTTNEVEGLNTNISSKWLVHRGLQRKHWRPFLHWFVYFRNRRFMS